MRGYNIRKARHADRLRASGIENRWNKANQYVINTGSSIALSTLELLAHKSNIAADQGYKLMMIRLDIDIRKDIMTVPLSDLPYQWKSLMHYPILQGIGSDWYTRGEHLVLEVPSVLVPWENNYLINTLHPDFAGKVSIHSVTDFEWDGRLL